MIWAVFLWDASLVRARDYVVPVKDVSGFFANLPKDATRVVFSEAAVYKCDQDIVLPDAQLLVIDGAGAKLVLGPLSNGFTRRVEDQRAASRMTASRYTIRDFAAIEGGRRGVYLAASLGSIISNCRFTGQLQAAIDLRFCLLCRVEHVLVTNPKDKGIVLRTGDWAGATAFNSQSNSTVLDQCRVYSSPTTTAAFTVLNSGGVRILDCISEGSPCDYDLFLSAHTTGALDRVAENTVVKSFMLENFHVEHAVRKASIHVNMPYKSSVSLRNVYWNGPQNAPVIEYMGGQLNLEDIGWWHTSFRIHTRVGQPRIDVQRCHSQLRINERQDRTEKRAGVLFLARALPGEETLDIRHVRVERSAW